MCTIVAFIVLDRKWLFLTINQISPHRTIITWGWESQHCLWMYWSTFSVGVWSKAFLPFTVNWIFVLVILASCCSKVLLEPVQPAGPAAPPPLLLQLGLPFILSPPIIVSVFSPFLLCFLTLTLPFWCSLRNWAQWWIGMLWNRKNLVLFTWCNVPF